jgi:anti-sigma factor RsiW
MKITREIVKDLLPLYAAGEASADTRAVVEEWLRDDPGLARLAEAMRGDAAPGRAAPAPPDAGRTALATAKTLLRRRTWLMAGALFFTGLPLSFAVGSDGLRFLMLRDAPLASAASLAVAGALWIAFARVARRVRVTGL